MSINFRETNQNDFENIIELNKELTLFNKQVLDIDDPLWTPEIGMKEFWEDKNFKFYICFIDSIPAGYVSGYIKENNNHKIGFVEQIYVKSEFRGRKIGKQLLELFIKYCKDNHCVSIRSIAFSNNIDSINFHKSFGFEEYYQDTILKLDL